MLKLRLLSICLLLSGLGRAQTPAESNKRLFDKTVDELNFRTFETVYDKSFTRGKFPVTLRTAAARKQFDQFGDNAGLKQLFLNYNAGAERYKGRFGNGPVTLPEFEKQLNSILLDKNFEFFIHNLPRDERVALIRAEQRLIKQASAQFNAAGATADDAQVAATDAQAEAPVSAPLTTNDAPAVAPAEEGAEMPIASTAPPAAPASSHDWLDYFTLLLSLTSVLMLGYLISSVLPALNRRISNLAGDPEPEPEAPSLLSRLRPAPRPAGLQRDSYEEDEEEEDEDQPRPAYDDRDDR